MHCYENLWKTWHAVPIPAVSCVELTVMTVSRPIFPGGLLTEAHSITFVLAPLFPGSVTGFTPCNETATVTPVSKDWHNYEIILTFFQLLHKMDPCGWMYVTFLMVVTNKILCSFIIWDSDSYLYKPLFPRWHKIRTVASFSFPSCLII